MTFELPELPYKYDALEPHIDAATMEIHHSKHHAGYVAKLNAALEGHKELQKKSIEEILRNIKDVPEDIRQAVINNGGGHANHSLFWTIMAPGGSKLEGELTKAIDSTFGSFDDFKNKFTEKAMGVFGSGWAFLLVNDGKLELKRHSFQNSPLLSGATPILGIDVWEHAYYLKYQNKKADYVDAWFNVINWKQVGENFAKAK